MKLKHLLHPIRALRRLEELEERIHGLKVTLRDDHQWLAHDATSRALTKRYLNMAIDSWGGYSPVAIHELRNRLGLNPYRSDTLPTAGPGKRLTFLTASYDLVTHMRRQIKFSTRAFGPGDRAQGVIDHISKELREIEADPADLEEWIDIVLLGLDGAWRSGNSPERVAAALDAKLTKNERRTWPDWRTVDRTKAIEHDRAAERQGGGS